MDFEPLFGFLRREGDAGALKLRKRSGQRKTVVILDGGNATVDQLAAWLWPALKPVP